jgi:hypothetical protein
MTIYEYKTIPLIEHPGLIPPQTIAKDLSDQAEDGWRFVAVVEKHHYPPLAILERELPGNKELQL